MTHFECQKGVKFSINTEKKIFVKTLLEGSIELLPHRIGKNLLATFDYEGAVRYGPQKTILSIEHCCVLCTH